MSMQEPSMEERHPGDKFRLFGGMHNNCAQGSRLHSRLHKDWYSRLTEIN